MSEKAKQVWNKYKPEIKDGSGSKLTAKDLTNVSIGGLCAVVLAGILHDGFGLDFNPEFYSAGGALIGLFVSRKLKY